ncbi:hypothetical protein CHUAL_000421 [Chamberlinius hualienensis]
MLCTTASRIKYNSVSIIVLVNKNTTNIYTLCKQGLYHWPSFIILEPIFKRVYSICQLFFQVVSRCPTVIVIDQKIKKRSICLSNCFRGLVFKKKNKLHLPSKHKIQYTVQLNQSTNELVSYYLHFPSSTAYYSVPSTVRKKKLPMTVTITSNSTYKYALVFNANMIQSYDFKFRIQTRQITSRRLRNIFAVFVHNCIY